MDPNKLRQYALVGAREEVKELLVGVNDLLAAFPRIAALQRAHDDLVQTLAALDAPRYTRERSTKPPRKPREEPRKEPRKQVPQQTPSGRMLSARMVQQFPAGEQNGASQPAELGQLRSWLAGRDVLALLSSEPMDSGQISKRLKLTRGATRWRLKVREGKGHVEQLDEAPDRWGITPEGREALERDMEAVPK